jgi:Bacteriophage HK97-gp10, putative tail-component
VTVAAKVTTERTRLALDKLAADVQWEIAAEVERWANAAARDAKRTPLFKDRTGKLRTKIAAFYTAGQFRATVRASTPYARFVESGTKPHVIEARRKKFLSFVVNGVRVFRKRVNHPGTAPRPFMALAAASSRERARVALDGAMSSAARAFNR